MDKQEDMLIVVDEVHYTVQYSRRREPYQLVGVWCRNPPFPVMVFEINYKASKEQITECIKTYNAGYKAGYDHGVTEVQSLIKRALKIRD